MEIFFGLIFIVGKLIYESYQEKKANEYADKVVRRYGGD